MEKKKIRIEKIGILAIAIALLMLLAAPSALAADAVVVTAPDGGEYWKTATENITWTQETTDATNDTFHVGYYTTGTTTWINTSLAAGTTHLIWDTTGVPDATGYKINVTKVNTYVGNTSDTSNATFTIDDTAPTVTITMTSAGLSGTHVYTFQSTLNFDGTITDDTSGNKNISVGGTTGTITSNSWTTNSVSITTGSTTVTATGYDNAGNSNTASVTVHRSTEKSGSSYVPPPAQPTYQPPAQPQPPLTFIPEEGLPDGVKKFGVLAIIGVVLLVVWHKTGSKGKRRK